MADEVRKGSYLIMQQGDVKLFQTNDDGDIIVEGGVVEMSGGLETAAYLAMFGGNEDDAGTAFDKTLEYWGNKGETESSKKYRSETQYLLRSIPAITSNLLLIKNAAIRDLAFFVTDNVASSVEVEVTMPGLNRVKISVAIVAIGAESDFEFTENWKAGE